MGASRCGCRATTMMRTTILTPVVRSHVAVLQRHAHAMRSPAPPLLPRASCGGRTAVLTATAMEVDWDTPGAAKAPAKAAKAPAARASGKARVRRDSGMPTSTLPGAASGRPSGSRLTGLRLDAGLVSPASPSHSSPRSIGSRGHVGALSPPVMPTLAEDAVVEVRGALWSRWWVWWMWPLRCRWVMVMRLRCPTVEVRPDSPWPVSGVCPHSLT